MPSAPITQADFLDILAQVDDDTLVGYYYAGSSVQESPAWYDQDRTAPADKYITLGELKTCSPKMFIRDDTSQATCPGFPARSWDGETIFLVQVMSVHITDCVLLECEPRPDLSVDKLDR